MNMNFIDKKVSVRRAIAILAKNGIEVNDDEATAIVDFLYLMAKNHQKEIKEKDTETPRRNRTLEKIG